MWFLSPKLTCILILFNVILVSHSFEYDLIGTVVEEYFDQGETVPSVIVESGVCKKFLLNGQTISREDAPILFNKKEWSGQTRQLQDRSGRVLVQVGKGVGLTDRKIGKYFGSEQHTIKTENLPRFDFGNVLANDGTGIGLQGNPAGTYVNYYKHVLINGMSVPIDNASPSIAVAWYLFGC